MQIAIVASAETSSASIKGTLRVKPAFAHTLMSRFFMGKEVCRSGELDGIFAVREKVRDVVDAGVQMGLVGNLRGIEKLVLFARPLKEAERVIGAVFEVNLGLRELSRVLPR